MRKLTEKEDSPVKRQSEEFENSSLITDEITDKQEPENIPEKKSCILADERRCSNIEDDIILIFLNSMMECVTER